MLKVRNKSRPYLDEERFQLFVPGTRNQGLVERIHNVLVIGDLMVNVRSIKALVLERLQVGEICVAALLEALARRVACGRGRWLPC